MAQSVSITLVTNPELERLFQSRFDLKAGDKLEGKVLDVRSDGKVLIDFGKFQAAVELKIPVKEGDVIHLVVVEKGKQLKLKIESVETADSGSKAPEGVEITVNREDLRQENAIKDIRSKLDRLAQNRVETRESAGPVNPQTEDIQTIYENIKTALQLLQSRLQVAGNTLELPEEIKQVFQNVQADLKLAEMSDTLIKQLVQLKTFVENSGIPYEKLVKEIVATLTGMLTRLIELKNSDRFQEMGDFIQNQVKPQLKSLADIFSHSKSMSEIENPQKLREIMQTVQSLQNNVEIALSSNGEILQNTLSQAMKNSNPKESIAALTKNIEALLERLPGSGNSSTTATTGATGSETALPGKIRALLDTLQTHFDPLDIGDDALKLVPRLKSLVENSGIFFEKKISDVITKLSETSSRMQDIMNLNRLPEIRGIIENDLKPNLLQLREFLNNEKHASQAGDQKTLETIRSAVEDLLNNISAQQGRAVESQAKQEPVQVFTFNLPIKNEEPAELKVFYNRERKKDSPDEYKLSLLLIMDKLGEVRSDFFYLKKDLTITFFVKEPRIKDFIEENLHDISETLSPEFKSLNLNVIVSQEKIAAFETEEKEAEYITERTVNIKI